MQETLTTQFELSTQKTFKNAVVATVNGQPHTAVVAATGSYITINEFKEIFNFIGELAQRLKLTKLVFDKRQLKVFHQPSMEWYFIEWKEQMFDIGLRTHRKILPTDKVFQQSVKIGRQSIAEKHPNGKYKQMDIAYAGSLDEAIAQ